MHQLVLADQDRRDTVAAKQPVEVFRTRIALDIDPAQPVSTMQSNERACHGKRAKPQTAGPGRRADFGRKALITASTVSI